MKLQEILDELAHQLDWRGPSGKAMGHIVLGRDDASTLVNEIMAMRVELFQLRQSRDIVIETVKHLKNPYGLGDPAETNGT